MHLSAQFNCQRMCTMLVCKYSCTVYKELLAEVPTLISHEPQSRFAQLWLCVSRFALMTQTEN